MLTLYHGTTSVCSIKVRLALAEKDIAWEGEVLDLQRGDQHRPDYAKLNPNEVVPTLVDDGSVIIESTLIIEYLDEAFAAPALMPADPYARAQARLWMKKIDDYLHAACSTVTFATANRKVLLRKTPEELAAHLAQVPDPVYRERQRLAVAQGLAAPHVAAWLARVRARPSFAAAVTGWLRPSDHERFTVPRDETAATVRRVLAGAAA